MADAPDERELDLVLARDQLHDLTMGYARGLDRSDLGLLQSIWHPDAQVTYGMFDGSAQDFCLFILDFVRALKVVWHSIANQSFEIEGDRALGEGYVIGVASPAPLAAGPYGFTGGRYVDRYARENGVWKIARRSFVMDWNMNADGSGGDTSITAAIRLQGSRAPEDPIYHAWAA